MQFLITVTVLTMFPDEVVVEAIHARSDVVGERHGLGPSSHGQSRELLEVAEGEAVRVATEALGLQGAAEPPRDDQGRLQHAARPPERHERRKEAEQAPGL